eukprot:jgi/Phyca11/110564/e_gw1.18.548.1
MRKLRQAKNRIEQATDDAERAEHEKKFKTYREEMMYIYYYPKTEPYIALFPPAVELLLKKPTKEQVKKQAKKPRSKRDKSGEKPKHTPALVDQDDDDEMSDAAKSESDKEEQTEEQEEDDFFL